jgi:hypothetical protein
MLLKCNAEERPDGQRPRCAPACVYAHTMQSQKDATGAYAVTSAQQERLNRADACSVLQSNEAGIDAPFCGPPVDVLYATVGIDHTERESPASYSYLDCGALHADSPALASSDHVAMICGQRAAAPDVACIG